MQLLASDIRTQEVLGWQGVHLLHFRFSSCSQKTRIFLKLKGIEWQSHHLNLAKQANYEDWFLGVNPRGLVPVLVHDGDVHIESNDILQYLDQTFPEPSLIPDTLEAEITVHLQEEDDLHLAIRAITMGFLSPKALVQKDDKLLDNYEQNRGTLQGQVDPHKAVEIQFWQNFADQGITEEQALDAAMSFHEVYSRFESSLSQGEFLLGDQLTLVDIAWYIYTFRLKAAGYPLELHPRLKAWFEKLNARKEFSDEVKQPFVMSAAIGALKTVQSIQKRSLPDVMRRGGLY